MQMENTVYALSNSITQKHMIILTQNLSCNMPSILLQNSGVLSAFYEISESYSARLFG